jgi:hypothetical protein
LSRQILNFTAKVFEASKSLDFYAIEAKIFFHGVMTNISCLAVPIDYTVSPLQEKSGEICLL